MSVSLQESFQTVVGRIIGQSADSTGDWSIKNEDGDTVLFIPKLDPDGFDITVVADQDEVTVYTEYFAHQHFTSDGDHIHISNLAMGLVRDLLSPLMRIRVVEVRGKISRGDIQISRDGGWHSESITGSIGFGLFGRRVEKFFINRRLPIRSNAVS